jgi:reactive intermediate/imine deaminase
MQSYDSSPFEPTDSARDEIWQMLVHRDIDAYLGRDWAVVADDFVAEGFFGLDALHKSNPAEWRLAFPSLDAYRHEWLRQAKETHRSADAQRARAALFAASTLTEIEICDDFALARKKFAGALPNKDGTSSALNWQTLYVCRKLQGRWRIASFVGYLPYDSQPARGWSPAAHRQHKTAGPYSPVITVERSGQLYVISGQAPLDDDGQVVGRTIEEQSRATLDNCRRQLAAAGCALGDVFKTTVYLTDLGHWNAFNDVYREYLSQPYPARTAVQTGLLPGFLVEVEMWAAKR